MQKGQLKIHAFKNGTSIPLEGVKITVEPSKETSNRQFRQNLLTDSSGLTIEIELEAPALENSINPSDKLPFNLYNIMAELPGYKELRINGCQIYPGVKSIQRCYLNPISTGQDNSEIIRINDNALMGNYPAKIPESDTPKHTGLSNLPDNVLPFLAPLVIPQTIILHDGHPDNASAPNYEINYKDYIKSVIMSEIYPTWPLEAIKANAYAIISFTLNRFYTEWYRGRGKKFDISNSTAMDQCCNRGIASTDIVDNIVDELFSTYISVPRYLFPLLAQYADGKRVIPPSGWLSQWGSKELADKGMNAEEILKHYYRKDLSLVKIDEIDKVPESYPGYVLDIGSTGEAVNQLQKSLNLISTHYPKIKKVEVNGVFGNDTKAAVKTFQSIFSLPQTGTVDYRTWYKISDIYVGISQMILGNRKLVEEIFTPPIFYRSDSSNVPTFNYPFL